jgi:class 3 adenylate cyclase
VEIPETRYAKSTDGAHIAFQTFGSGDRDLLVIKGNFSNLDGNWDIPEIADMLRRLSAFARVIAIDRRGMGLSDPLAPGTVEPLETHIDDVIAVMAAAHVDRACVFASENAAPLAIALAATHPDRVQALALYAPLPTPLATAAAEWEDIPAQERALLFTPEFWRNELDQKWGTGWAREEYEMFVPSHAGDEAAIGLWGRYVRSAASPGSAVAFIDHWLVTDVRRLYPSVQAPTLLLFRPHARPATIMGRLVAEAAEAIADAHVTTLAGRDLPCWFGDRAQVTAELEEFFTGASQRPDLAVDRILSTVLFTDIVGSTERAAEIGDTRWKDLVESHHGLVRMALAEHRGLEMDTAGDGFYAVFDGPARAIRCARSIIGSVRNLGIQVRAGVHTGECEVIDGKYGGIAVATGARIAAAASPSEILVSQTVKDLVAGSGLGFEARGSHELKGIPGRWQLYAVVAS